MDPFSGEVSSFFFSFGDSSFGVASFGNSFGVSSFDGSTLGVSALAFSVVVVTFGSSPSVLILMVIFAIVVNFVVFTLYFIILFSEPVFLVIFPRRLLFR
ncbi:MAG: hypothetical protein ABI691_17215 [Ginsengibacter sp.]